MYCRECGKEIFDKAVVCPHCGCATSSLTNNEKVTPWESVRRFYRNNKGTILFVILFISVMCLICGITDIVQTLSDNSSGSWRGDTTSARVSSPNPVDIPLIIIGLFGFFISIKKLIMKK